MQCMVANVKKIKNTETPKLQKAKSKKQKTTKTQKITENKIPSYFYLFIIFLPCFNIKNIPTANNIILSGALNFT